MSNDLISRSAVLDIMRSRLNSSKIGSLEYQRLNSISADVKNMPTAYDVDKVVEQIKCNSQNIVLLYPDDQGGDYEYADGIEVNRAIEIVKSELKEHPQ